MDPVGPWSAYASYNRLAGVQAGAASGDFHHHLASGGSGLSGQSVPSTTSQLLLQAAHTASASLAAGQLGSSSASPFNPGGFLSPPTVGYDAMFSPLFHHASPKPAHYSSSALQAQHRQVLAQAQAAAASKQSAVESEISSLRENYSHQALAQAQGTAFFDQQASGGAGLNWQGNNQLPSPFGILPHESVVPSSPSPATTKASAAYENFNAHFAAAQTLNNHLNSQISSASKQANRSGSPATASKQPATSTSSSSFYQAPGSFGNQTDNSYSGSSSKNSQLQSQDYAGKQRGNASTVAPTSQQPNLNNSLQDTSKVMDKKFNVPTTGPGAGFMASYLKFLQGERDTSPPPAGRGARKATWSRTNTAAANNVPNKPYNPNEHKASCDTGAAQQNANGAMAGNMMNPMLGNAMGSAGVLGANTLHASSNLVNSQMKGVELDPPYYVNKERKRKYDGSEEAYEEEEARRQHGGGGGGGPGANKPVLNVPSTPLSDKSKKGRASVSKAGSGVASPPAPAGKKPRAPPPPPAPQPAPQQQYYYQHQPDEGAFNLFDYHSRSRARW